jgi:hypothetical protein
MSGGFFWLAIFPMILGGIIITIYIFFLKKEGEKPENPDSKRITPAKFINEVAQYSNIDDAEAKRIIEFVFGYFPDFNWTSHLPKARNRKTYEGREETAKKGEPKV